MLKYPSFSPTNPNIGALFSYFLPTLLCLIVLLLVVPTSSFAAEGSQEIGEKNLPFDVRIVVDISGSMKQTDPNNLRIPAVNLLLELMPEGAQAGIWTFGQYVNNILPVAPVDQQWREKAKRAALAINSVGLKTNLTGVLNDAAWGLKADSGFQQSIILLTDGQIDMAADNDSNPQQTNTLEEARLMSQVLEKYRKAGASIHTLALSDMADKILLQKLAIETGGLYSQADDAEGLMNAFLRAFDRAVPAEQVPMEDNTFVIDSSVDEFTALIFKSTNGSSQESALLSPSGIRLSALDHPQNVRWHKDISFDLITIKQPEAGTWVAEADLDPANRVTILSDLALSVAGIPATSFPDDKLDVIIKLTNEGQVVNKAEILRLTDIKMSMITASGRQGSKVLSNPENPPADGLFYEGLHRVREVGQYQIDIIAEGKTFQRKRSISMTVMEPVEIIQQPDIENNLYRILVKPLASDIDLERTRVIAKIKSPDDSTKIQSVLYDSELQAWVSEVAPNKGSGEYSVDLNVRGITESDRNFKVTPPPVIFDLPIKTVTDTAPEKSEELVESLPSVEQAITEEPVAEKPGIAVDTEANSVATVEGDKALVDNSANDLVESTNNKDEGLAWWVYLLIALAGLSVVGAIAWWFLLRKPAAVDAQTERDKKEMLADLEDPEDELSGDFDSLDEGEEEEIPQVTEPVSLEGDSLDEVVEDATPQSAAEPPVLEDAIVDDLPTEESQAEESQVEESQVEESQVEESQVEESQVEESQVEESQVEESQVEESQVEELATTETPANSIDDEGFPTEDDFDENFSIDPDDDFDFDEDSWGEFDEDKDDKKD